MATAKPAAKAATKKKKSGFLVWGILGLLILLLGAGSAYYYVKRDALKKDARLKVIQDFVDKVDATLSKGADTLKGTLDKGKAAVGQMQGKEKAGEGGFLFGGGSHVVKPGESLWSIAQKGDLVSSPWDWGVIMAQNLDKIDYAFISDEDPKWQVVLIPGNELSVSKNTTFEPEVSKNRKYTVQMVSLPDGGFDRGVFLVRTLMKDGYYAYLYRTDLGKRAVYRLRSGFYDSEEEARAMGQRIREKYKDKEWFTDEPWVSIPESDELLGTLLDFGAL
ncbi:MAG: SPOR domain-containing protein, partial [Deltaproteobacteria bacterium]|nr:SPOR domain-containing protein [Deltaproteobacteria bacterium]